MIKIDYQNGQGNGAVLWELGKDGDFTCLGILSWFSHQHDARWLGRMLLYDNGNTRAHSDRGQQPGPARARRDQHDGHAGNQPDLGSTRRRWGRASRC